MGINVSANLCYGIPYELKDNDDSSPWVKDGFKSWEVEEWLYSLHKGITICYANDLMCHAAYVVFTADNSSYVAEGRNGWSMEGMINKVEVPEGTDELLKQFCEKTGIPYQQPAWYITNFWC